MDCEKVGKLLLSLRKEKEMTQKELASKMNISDRTISRWERGIGCPDVSLLRELSSILQVNIEKILLGDLQPNALNTGNMKHIQFYVCPYCSNVLFSTGDNEVSCCGRRIDPLKAQKEDDKHEIFIEEIENDLYISSEHEMTKKHYITFVAYVSYDRVLLVRLYPEQSMQVRIPNMHNGTLYIYCNRHGLMRKNTRNA